MELFFVSGVASSILYASSLNYNFGHRWSHTGRKLVLLGWSHTPRGRKWADDLLLLGPSRDELPYTMFNA